MVRKTSRSSSQLKRVLLIPLSFLSIVIVTSIVLLLLSIRQDKQLTYKDSIQQIADDFTLIERNYAYLFNEIVTKRQPVADSVLSQTTDSYQQLNKRINQISDTKDDSETSLNEIIANRISNLAVISELNIIIRAEFDTANSLENYNICKQKISFNQSASKVYPQINGCTKYITEAQSLAMNIPSISFAVCKLDETPVYIINQMVAVHEKLVTFYRYSAQHKTKEAAAADVQYRTASNAANKLPKWNKCITEYLQKRGEELEN